MLPSTEAAHRVNIADNLCKIVSTRKRGNCFNKKTLLAQGWLGRNKTWVMETRRNFLMNQWNSEVLVLLRQKWAAAIQEGGWSVLWEVYSSLQQWWVGFGDFERPFKSRVPSTQSLLLLGANTWHSGIGRTVCHKSPAPGSHNKAAMSHGTDI